MHVALFLPRHMSLDLWKRVGLFDFSTGLYKRLAEMGWEVTFVTTGNRSDLRFGDQLPGIKILCNSWGLPPRVYERWLPWLHWGRLRRSDVIKSYQVDGADIAYRAACLLGKPFVARCGYLLSDFAERGHADQQELARARRIEATTFQGAARAVVTTQWMREYLERHYGVGPGNIRVIPNYVLTDHFSPEGAAPIPGRLTFVGRLEQQKNPLALVEACGGLEVELVMAGAGTLGPAIRKLADQVGSNVRLLGVLSHNELPDLLRQSTLFVLPSAYEGHPKALLEAMSCGLPVIAGDTLGINDLVKHRETGWLCATDPHSIREAIVELLNNPALRAELGRRARDLIVEQFSFECILNLEQAMLEELVS